MECSFVVAVVTRTHFHSVPYNTHGIVITIGSSTIIKAVVAAETLLSTCVNEKVICRTIKDTVTYSEKNVHFLRV